MAFNNDLLINQDTGALDRVEIRSRAFAMAQRDYPGQTPPAACVRSYERGVMDLARGIRSHWFADRGLPDPDGEPEMVDVSDWGDRFTRMAS